MKTIYKTALIGTVLSLTSLYAIQGIAGPRGGYMGDCGNQERSFKHSSFKKQGKGMKMGRHEHRLLAGLDLSQEQQDQIADIDREYNEKFYQLDKQLRDNRFALSDLNAGATDADKTVEELAEEHGKLVAETLVLKHEKRSKVEALLTEEQATQLADMKMQRRSRWSY